MPINNDFSKEKELGIRELIEQKQNSRNFKEMFEKAIPFFLFLIASISILTTIGIVYTLII